MLFVVSMLSATLIVGQAPAPAASSAHISGRVLTEGANTPIAGARVILIPIRRSSGPIGPPPQTTTDQDGRYAFQNVAPGTYHIEAQRAGFAQNTDSTTPRTISIVAGQAIDNVDISLALGGAIAGRILDPSGAPLPDIRVMAMRRMERPGMGPRLMPAPAQGQQTNDLGEFRAYGLAAGTYYLAAMTPPAMFGGMGAPAAATASVVTTLATTFYPSTTDAAGAQPITVAAGDTVPNISLTMQSAPAFHVSGVVVDDSGEPVSGAMVILTGDPQSSNFMGPAGRATSEGNGRFVIGGVTSGHYRAMATVPVTMRGGGESISSSGISGGVSGGAVSGAGGTISFGTVAGSAGINSGMTQVAPPTEVAVADADVTGLRIILRR
ncbi:MAG TPA: carboxypeptidase-like regulatory domain-containing protein [Vicinamibacterales bacterium]|jgi:hypothetical protein|nr:carboxypeptidase-like regulatory domain-containing protein [Vicinamibacterales bacterium]